MLPNNFEALASKLPEFRSDILRIGEWASLHGDWRVLDPRILSRDLRDIDPLRLSLALHGLVSVGSYRQIYMVVTPEGVLAEGEYNTPLDIPGRVRDGFNHTFKVEDGDIVPVFKPVR